MKDFLTLACERYSVRKYSEKEIEDEKLEKILMASQVAPTSNNCQPQRIFVIKSEEALEKVRSVTPYCFNAPVVLMVCYDETVSRNAIDGHNYGFDDAIIATAHMMLEAYDIGIGSVWVRGYDKRKLDATFELTENLVSVALLPIGYPCENSKPSKAHFKNIEMKDMVTYI